MQRYAEYASRIGCVVYAVGALHDTIECTEQQARLLAEWWEANTK